MLIRKDSLLKMVGFLDRLRLKGRASLGRTKLKESLVAEHAKVVEDQVMIIDEYDGWINQGEGSFDMDNQEMVEVIAELLMEETRVEFQTPFKAVFIEAIEEYEEEMTGEDADAYSNLYSQLMMGTSIQEEKGREGLNVR